MDSEALSERIIVPMSKSMVDAINDYRFANRLESRAEAIRQLVEIALAAEKTRKGGKK